MLARLQQQTRHSGPTTLQPTTANFLVWLHHRHRKSLAGVTLLPELLTGKQRPGQLMDTALFHILACVHLDPADLAWLALQRQHIEALVQRATTKIVCEGSLLADELCLLLQLETVDSHQKATLQSAIALAQHAGRCSVPDLACWIRSMSAPSVRQACLELANLTNIPGVVVSDILLRTAMTHEECVLQLDLWKTFLAPVCVAYHHKQSHIKRLVKALCATALHFDPAKLPPLIDLSLSFLTSTRSGFAFNVFSTDFTNDLIYYLAFAYIRPPTQRSPLPVIKAQNILASHITHHSLSLKGFIGVTLAFYHQSQTKAKQLFGLAQNNFALRSDAYYIGKLYLQESPEGLLHDFSEATSRFPQSSGLWLILVRKLRQFDLLNETRAQSLLDQILQRKEQLVLSKDLMAALIKPVQTVSGMESFISQLREHSILDKFRSVVLNKYMAVLYRNSRDISVHKPYLDTLVRSRSNLECARHLYSTNLQKTVACVGIMLNGEVGHQPEHIFRLYTSALEGRLPDEACLLALLRASMVKSGSNFLLWGEMYAPQVAVHEFKTHVCMLPSDSGVTPSVALWRMYLKLLVSAGYASELAGMIRWWSDVDFVPSKELLTDLLWALPEHHRKRHIQHALSLPRTDWPWPTLDEFDEKDDTS